MDFTKCKKYFTLNAIVFNFKTSDNLVQKRYLETKKIMKKLINKPKQKFPFKLKIKNKFILSLLKKWRSLKKIYRIIIIVILVIIVLVSFFKIRGKKAAFNNIQVDRVTKQTIERKVLRSGTIDYRGLNSVVSSSDGEVTALYVANGDEVKKGAKLFQVTSTANQEEKAQAWSAYLSAKNALERAKQGTNQTQSSLESARQALLRAEQAVKDAEDNRGDYTDKEFEALQSAERAARLNLTLAESDTTTVEDKISAAEADLQVAWLQYQATRDLTVVSTTAGRVENLSITEGDIVNHLDTVPTLLLVSNPKQVIQVSIGEIDAALLEPGQSAEISVDAFPDDKFQAHISRVDTVGVKSSDSTGVTYTAWLELDEVYPGLLSGMAADVEILVETKEDVLAVPNSALQYRAGEYYLNFGDETKKVQQQQQVEIGIRNDEFTEIISGVDESQSILIMPQ